MVFTRSQAKKQQEQQKQPQQRQQIHRKCKKTLHEITTNTNTRSPIDFIDASIEWRKNKIKRENCTFEYIFL